MPNTDENVSIKSYEFITNKNDSLYSLTHHDVLEWLVENQMLLTEDEYNILTDKIQRYFGVINEFFDFVGGEAHEIVGQRIDFSINL